MTISSEIIEVLEYLCGKFGIAIDWTQENILPYVQSLGEKLIQYEISTSIFWIIFTAVITILLSIATIILYFPAKKVEFNTGETQAVFFIACLTCALCSMVITGAVIADQSIDILTAIHFPEKSILDTIENLTSTTT